MNKKMMTLVALVSCTSHHRSETPNVYPPRVVAPELKERALVPRPIVIGHRGASGYLPEHTIASYTMAIEMGADFVEPDLVSTRDGYLIARHENEIGGTTDVAQKFPERKTKKTVDGKEIEGWFTEDFTLLEIKSLFAKQRLEFRDQSKNQQFRIPTFEEILDLVKNEGAKRGRVIGVYPETKHSSYFSSIHLPLEETLLKALKSYGYTKKNSPIFIQSFETSNLKWFSKHTKLPLIQLLDEPQERPYDLVLKGDKRTYADLMKPEGLAEIASYAQGIGPWKRSIVPDGADKQLLSPTTLVKDAHRVSLLVHPYTFRNEAAVYLAPEYHSNPSEEYREFFELGVDGVFSDFSDTAIRARTDWMNSLPK